MEDPSLYNQLVQSRSTLLDHINGTVKANKNMLIADKLSQMLSIEQNSYKKKAYVTAIKGIQGCVQAIESGKQAINLKIGVGKSIAEKIDQILATGDLEIINQMPSGDRQRAMVIAQFKTIHGVGDKAAEKWYDVKGARSFQDLNNLVPEMTAAQQMGFHYHADLQLKIPREEIDLINRFLHNLLDSRKCKFEIVGSYRRGVMESGDIDVLVEQQTTEVGASKELAAQTLMDAIIQLLVQTGFIIGTLAHGGKNTKYMGIVRAGTYPDGRPRPARRLDIRLIEAHQWPYATLYFTGSQYFNIESRKRAMDIGMKLSEYDLVDVGTGISVAQLNKLQVKQEEDIFKMLSIIWLSPKERTDNCQIRLVGDDTPILPPAQPMNHDTQMKFGRWSYDLPTCARYMTDEMQRYLGQPIKIAAFDMDGTLLVTASGNKFAKTIDDSRLMNGRLSVLRQLVSTGYTIVIFTNQKSKGEKREFNKQKLARIILDPALLGTIPLIMLASFDDDKYRKPNAGMWLELKSMILTAEIDQANSFYCGDAACRPGDFSDSDLKFAQTVGLRFYTPEQGFLV